MFSWFDAGAVLKTVKSLFLRKYDRRHTWIFTNGWRNIRLQIDRRYADGLVWMDGWYQSGSRLYVWHFPWDWHRKRQRSICSLGFRNRDFKWMITVNVLLCIVWTMGWTTIRISWWLSFMNVTVPEMWLCSRLLLPTQSGRSTTGRKIYRRKIFLSGCAKIAVCSRDTVWQRTACFFLS